MASRKCHKLQNNGCVGRVTKDFKMDEDVLKCVFTILPQYYLLPVNLFITNL